MTVDWDGNSARLVETVNSKGFRFPFTKIPTHFSELPDFLVLRDLKSRTEREKVMCGGQRSTSLKISLSHEKDFEGERKRDHVKSIRLLLSDFFMVLFEDAICTALREAAVTSGQEIGR